MIDGLGDAAVPSPLQSASTFTFDSLASTSFTGYFHSVNDHTAPGSDLAHLSLFGQPLVGRGVLEALGAGVTVGPGQTCYKCVVAAVDKCGKVQRHPLLSRSETETLLKQFLSHPKFVVQATEKHRFVAVFSGVTDFENDPFFDNLPIVSKGEAKSELRVIVETANEKLKEQGLALLFRAPASLPNNFRQLNDVVLISDADVILGIGRASRMKVFKHSETDISQIFSQLRNEDQNIFLHFEKTDYYSHQGEQEQKSAAIERIDRIVGQIINTFQFETIIVTGDHATPCALKEHSADGSPLLVWRRGMTPKIVTSFDEIGAGKGQLGVVIGEQLGKLAGFIL